MFVTRAIRFQAEGKLYIFTFFSNAEEVLKTVGHATKT
jgi:hypothetical protein